MKVRDKIRQLINLIEDTEINDLELTSFWGMQKIKISKNIQNKLTLKNIDSNIDEHVVINSKKTSKDEVIEHNVSKEEIPKEPDIQNNLITIKAPLVGTFYQSSSPESQPFVTLGKKIKKGDILCIIEAMKIFNEIESEYEGEIVSIEIDDASPVEYSQALFKLKPLSD